MNEGGARRGGSGFTRQVLIAVAIGLLALAIAFFLRQVGGMMLVLFAGGMLAVFLDGLARPLRRAVPIARHWAVTIAILALAMVIGLSLWFLGKPLANQLALLAERLPQDIAQVNARLQGIQWLSALFQRLPAPERFFALNHDLMPRLFGLFSTAAGALTSLLIIVFVGLYLALDPFVYIAAVRRLIPPRGRPRADQVLSAIVAALRYWLVGRLSSMVIVGILTGAGLWAIGMPVAVSLGFITGLLVFVPYIGPILSLIPALLVALTMSVTMVAYVIFLYVGVQLLESYFITPLIQERTVSLPPAFLISSQVISGVLFGMLGIVLAVPLTVAATVIVQMLYIEDLLGDTGRPVLGDAPMLGGKPRGAADRSVNRGIRLSDR